MIMSYKTIMNYDGTMNHLEHFADCRLAIIYDIGKSSRYISLPIPYAIMPPYQVTQSLTMLTYAVCTLEPAVHAIIEGYSQIMRNGWHAPTVCVHYVSQPGY